MKSSRAMDFWRMVFSGTMTIVFAFVLVRSLVISHLSWSWPPVTATVTRVEEQPKSATVQYAYSISGQHHVGDRFSILSEGTIVDKEIIFSRYKVGDRITIHVDPSRPSESVIELRAIALQYISVYLFILIFCGAMFAHSLWILRER